MTAVLLRTRRHTLSRPRLSRALGTGALVAATAGLVFALDGSWGAAACALVGGAIGSWVAGVWTVPLSEDAYHRRLMGAAREAAAQVEWWGDDYARGHRGLLRRLSRLDPPAPYRELHRRLLEFAQDSEHSNLEAPPGEGRHEGRLQRMDAWRDLRSEIAALDPEQRDRPYVVRIRELLGRRESQFAATSARTISASQALSRKVAEMRRPESISAEHDALVVACRDYGVAFAEVQSSWAALDTDGARTALAALERAEDRVQSCYERIVDRLGVE